MKMIKNMLLAAIAAAGCTAPAMAVGNVVIAEVYGAGGNNGATYNADYAVLFNRSSTSQTLTNWSIQYAAQTGINWSKIDIVSATIPAGGYYLIKLSTTGANGVALPTPDLDSTGISAAAGSGKLALMRNTTLITSGASGIACPVTDATFSANLEDFVQYGVLGTTNGCGEGGVATGTALTATTAAKRNGNGCVDTDNNAADFTAGAPTPRNSTTALNPCGSGGACCNGLVCTIVSGAGACTGTFQGNGSTCTPTNPCLPPQGSCCVASSTNCTITSQADCNTAGGTWALAGTCTPTNPCSGTCCVGTTCTLTSALGCTNGAYTLGATCGPTACPAEVQFLVGDVAYGASVPQLFDSVPQVRNSAGTGNRVGTQARFPFVQSVEFDNSGGGNHNPQGNLLALNFGANATAGAILHNLSTNGSGLGQTLLTIDAANTLGLQASRAAGLSVSPDNTKIAFNTTDAARIVVLNYNAGATPGTGAGASVSAGSQSDNINFVFAAGQTSGTAWNGNNELIVYVNSSDLNTLGPAIFTIPVDSAGVLGTPVFRLNPTVTGFAGTSRFYSLAYNPSISNFVYALASDFLATPAPGVSTTRLSVIDPSTWTEVKSINLSTSMETGREIAIGADRNLYLANFAGSTFQVGVSALIDRLNLDVDNSGTITLSDIMALTDNSSVNWYSRVETPTVQNTAAFNGLDIAVSTGAPQTGACCLANGSCSVTTSAACIGGSYQGNGTSCTPNNCPQPTGACCLAGGSCSVTTSAACIGGTYQGNGTSCTPNPCPQPTNGRCCVGARCTVVATAGACTALEGGNAGSVFTSGTTTCNATGNFTAPCCFANYNKSGGITVQDIFDFLSGWFANSPNANVEGNGTALPTVQDIFDFLAAWFAGGCS